MDDQPNKQDGSAPPVGKPTDTPATALTYASVESSMCSASTLGHSVTSNAVVTTQQQSGEGTESLQRSMLEQQAYMLGLLSAGSFGTFLFIFLPYSALLAFGIFVSSISALFYVFYRILMLEWNNIIQGRGIGQYLPSSIYELLTSTTLHEWMSDPTFWNEYRHLLLYSIPGITQEQLDSYLARLHPRHVRTLNRPGLGHFFGDDFMRIIMGESRWTPSTENTSRRLLFDFDDENSSVGLEVTNLAGDEDQARLSGSVQSREIVVASPSTDTAAENQRLIDEEGALLTDAVSTAAAAYGYWAADILTGYTLQAVDYASSIVIGTGISLTSGAIGIGLWGWWLGVYHPSRISMPSPHFPPSRTLMSTAVFGSASASLMLLCRCAVRWSIKKERQENGSEKADSEDKNK